MAKQTGIRKIEDIDGGVMAWLHPGDADLDDVLLVLARHLNDAEPLDGWTETTFVPRSEHPDIAAGDRTDEEWATYFAACDAWRAAADHRIDEDHPTGKVFPTHTDEVEVGYYRRMPWCHCGEGHTWHYEPTTGPGPGACLAVVVSSW